MTVLEQISTSSLANVAFERLVEAISSGRFQPGERLSEASLARQLGISRGPLREALQRLEGRLVVRKPNIGVHVIEFTDEHLRELFNVREALEGMAARLAAEHVTSEDIAGLNSLLQAHAHEPKVVAGESYRQGTNDEDFHFLIVRVARNKRLSMLLFDHVYYQLRLYRFRASERPGRAQDALKEHLDIVGALNANDADAAERAMRNHIRNAYASLVGKSA